MQYSGIRDMPCRAFEALAGETRIHDEMKESGEKDGSVDAGKVRSNRLVPLVYDELRRIARERLSHESPNHTLQPTELVHEAWLRTVGEEDRTWDNRSVFFAAAAVAMRRILVEHARRKSRIKRGRNPERVDIDLETFCQPQLDDRILLVNAALERLEQVDPQRARIVELKFFAGLTNKEVAEMLDMGERSVARHWLCARTWLFKEIQKT